MAAEVAHGGGIAVTHLHQTSRGEPLERFAHRGAGDSEHLCQAPLARQGLAWLHLTAEHLGDDLLEDLLGHGSAVHRLQGHAYSVPGGWPEVKWPDQLPRPPPGRITRLRPMRAAPSWPRRARACPPSGAP